MIGVMQEYLAEMVTVGEADSLGDFFNGVL